MMSFEVTQSAFEIEKNVPVPGKATKNKPVFPFALMQPGDSFKFPKTIKSKVSGAAYVENRSKTRKFVIRGNRCWRIK